MEIEDLSELCRLCLESSTTLIPFETTLHFSTKSIPELIKYCIDLNCNFNDGGISPKNLCQACMDKLQMVHEFKWKSHESDKYLKQIISHSGIVPTVDDADITPYNPPDLHSSMFEHDDDEDETNLLTPMEPAMNFDYTDQVSNAVERGLELRKGQRHGEFHCRICDKYFKYVKPYKNHVKLHKQSPKKLSYYKRKKLLMAQEASAAAMSASLTKTAGPRPTPFKSKVKGPPKRSEPQAQYDSLSPYNSPPPYEKESMALHTNRDSSPDFGEFMLQTSRQLLNGTDYEDEDDGSAPPVAPAVTNNRGRGRPSKNNNRDYSPGPRQARSLRPAETNHESIIPDIDEPQVEKRRARFRASNSTKEANHDDEEDDPPPKKRPGPLSKTRVKTKPREEEVTIEGFSEVDISKMLKKKKDDTTFVQDSGSRSQSSTRSRGDRSPSVELIPEVDIFGRG